MPTFSACDGTQLAYHVRGEGTPLLCLPGGPLRASAYLGALGGLTAHRRLILLDPRGTGDSREPADPATYRCDRQIADVEALREHLGLARIDLLGHSAGATLAVLYAAAHPQRLAGLVLVTGGTRAVGIKATDPDGRDAQAHAASDGAPARLYYANGALGDPDATRTALATVTAPVLVLAGEYDGGPTPARAAELAALFPHGRPAVQPGAAHYPWRDDPGAFTRTVAAFLNAPVRD
ncbi:alpha/beta hydrolase [Streptomyces ficellus]|uniref:Alpha/beta hydrolase n=1 Tax=Streptomyces ficellus TaxID=1977088 RepID=A0ABT7Z2E1_9ACTN|nr:alpha/beta hydrolase [Streptomyces ficellus]MDN3293276.1 alpha/beta hydrolase [Streptomyces ficellus]